MPGSIGRAMANVENSLDSAERFDRELQELQSNDAFGPLDESSIELFNELSHSNESLRVLTTEVLRSWPEYEKDHAWKSVADFPEPVLCWFKGQIHSLPRYDSILVDGDNGSFRAICRKQAPSHCGGRSVPESSDSSNSLEAKANLGRRRRSVKIWAIWPTRPMAQRFWSEFDDLLQNLCRVYSRRPFAEMGCQPAWLLYRTSTDLFLGAMSR